jgi:outer membrane protein TolC
MLRFIIFLMLTIFIRTSVHSQSGVTLDLDALIQEAIGHNPQLHSAHNQTAAAKAGIQQVTSLDAPQIGVEFYQMPISSFPLKNNMETDYFVQQMFPWPGKLSMKGKSAENFAGMKEQESQELNNKIIRDLKAVYYELYLIYKKIEINEENKRNMRKIIDIALKQYEVGNGTQSEILRSQTELTKLVNEAIELEKNRRIMESMINTLIGRPANERLEGVPEITVRNVRLDFDRLMALADEKRPELKAMEYNIKMYRSEYDLTKRELYPDIMVRGMYKNMSETKDYWSLMVGVDVPIAFWSKKKYRNKIYEFEHHVNHAQMEYKDKRNMIGNEIQNALVTLESSLKQAEEIKTNLIPQAEASLNAALAAYQAGKTSFVMVLDSYRMLLMAKLDYAMNIMNAAVSESRLEQAVGLSMEKIKERLN